MSFLLEISSPNGTINLTQYVAGEPGSGLEPGDPHFTNKVFAHSLLKPGGTLALEDLQLKEMVFPLKLHAKSKPELLALVQELNIIINTQGAQVAWQDEGASRPTYFGLASGQFDDEFDYHRGTQNWLVGKLRLFTQPLGSFSAAGPRALYLSNKATTIAIGTTPVTVFKASGPLEGDGAALLQAQLTASCGATYSLAAFSVLPSSEYRPFLPIATMSRLKGIKNPETEPEVYRASQIPYGTAARWKRGKEGAIYPAPEEIAQWNLLGEPAESYAYVGEQRLVVLARIPTTGGTAVSLRASSENKFSGHPNYWTGPAATVATSTWSFYDLGVLSVASADLFFGEPYGWGIYMTGPSGSYVDTGGAVQLPESSTTWLNGLLPAIAGASLINRNSIHFDGVANRAAYGEELGVAASGVAPLFKGDANVTGYLRGAIPAVTAKATSPVLAGLFVNAFEVLPTPDPTYTMNTQLLLNVNVLERCRFAFG